jgi:hypothetical protein
MFRYTEVVEETDLGSKHSLAVDEVADFDARSFWSPSGNRNRVWASAVGALGPPGDGSRLRIPGGICTLVTMETPPQEYKLQGRGYRPLAAKVIPRCPPNPELASLKALALP